MPDVRSTRARESSVSLPVESVSVVDWTSVKLPASRRAASCRSTIALLSRGGSGPVGVAVSVGVGVGVGVVVGVAVAVGVAVSVAVTVGVAVSVGVTVSIGVGVAVSVGVRVGVAVSVSVSVAVTVSVVVGVSVAVSVGVVVSVVAAASVASGVEVASDGGSVPAGVAVGLCVSGPASELQPAVTIRAATAAASSVRRISVRVHACSHKYSPAG
jgi:hypothetical protein